MKQLDEAVRIRPEFFQPPPQLTPDWTPAQRAAAETACANRQSGFATDYVRAAIAEAKGHSGEAKEWAAKAEATRDEILAPLQARAPAAPRNQRGYAC